MAAYSPAVSRSSKGQVKCFKCRSSFPLKEGDWHNSLNRQVFLCKPCGVRESQRTAPSEVRHG